MPFELDSPALQGLIGTKVVHEVKIHRALSCHSEATVVLDWNDNLTEGQKMNAGSPTARAGAALLNAEVVLRWRGLDLTKQVDCFHGYVTGVSAQHHDTRTQIVLSCISHSKRADLIPRYRAWQSCTLADVCKRVQSGDSKTISIHPEAQSVLAGITIDLSVQYAETDFAYLSRMLHAWGIPLSVDDRGGKLVIGMPTIATGGQFPPSDWHWDTIALEGELVPVDGKPHTATASPVGVAQQKNNDFNGSLPRTAADYLPRLDDDNLQDQEWMIERVYEAAFQTNTAVYRLVWHGSLFDYSPGAAVSFGNASYLIREVNLTENASGGFNPDAVSQEFILQEQKISFQKMKRRVLWPTRTFWAVVKENYAKDPTRQGRLQVQFDWEAMDSEQNSERCWLSTVTPYGGLKGTGTSGFLSLPEVGERVLVQFLGDWDSDAVILGSVREYARQGFPYDPHETKRWQTPSGNQITLTTRGDGATEIVAIKVKDQLIFEGKIDGSKQTVIMDVFGSADERIHFEKGAGPARLDIFCSGEIYMHAGQKLLLEGGMVQIKSTMGAINIDGAPMVMINCSPWSLQPLKLSPDKATEVTGKKKSRAKPAKWMATTATGAAVVGAAAVASQKQDVQDFIEVVLKDDTGNPVPNERYRLKMPDGSIKEGRVDANGKARFDGLKPGSCQVSFPNLGDGDWKPV